jgi:hypothetical protein
MRSQRSLVQKAREEKNEMKSLELTRVFAVVIGASALSAGCVAHAQAGVSAEAEPPVVFAEPPTLVAVDGGVWVVRDSDYATYYVDDYYWVYRDGTWYRSRTYDGGWVVAEVAIVPTVIVYRDAVRYVHFRGEANARTRRAPHEGEKGRDTATDAPRHDEGHGDGDHRERRDEHEDRADNDRHEERAGNDRHEDHPDTDRHDERAVKNGPPPAAGNEHKNDGAQPGRAARAGGGAAPSPPKKAEKKHDKQ